MEVKIFHVGYDGYVDIIVAETEESAKACCVEDNGIEDSDVEFVKEIPESEWDDRTITIWEDNNRDNESFEVTYRQEMSEVGLPYIMASTNPDWID